MVLAKLISLPVSIILLVWMFRIKKENPFPKSSVAIMLIGGLLSALIVTVVTLLLDFTALIIRIGPSAFFALISNPQSAEAENTLAQLTGTPSLLNVFISTFIVTALLEELIKYGLMRACLRRPCALTCQMDALVCGATVGLFFQIVEDLVYASEGVATAIMRAVTPYHFTFGAIMGYYYGKSVVTGRKSDRAKALLLPVLIHGLFDFSIKCLTISDNYIILTLIVMLFMCALSIYMIVKIHKWSTNGALSAPIAENA